MRATDAHTVALYNIVRDMRHALRWIAGGLLMLSGYMLLSAGFGALEGDSGFLVGFRLFAGAWWMGCAYGTYKRSQKYHEGGKP